MKRTEKNFLARHILIRASLHLQQRNTDDLSALMTLHTLIESLELQFRKLTGSRVRRSAHNRVSNAVSTRVQRLATVCGTERPTDGLVFAYLHALSEDVLNFFDPHLAGSNFKVHRMRRYAELALKLLPIREQQNPGSESAPFADSEKHDARGPCRRV